MWINTKWSNNTLSVEQEEIIHTLQQICNQLQTRKNYASFVIQVLSSPPNNEKTKYIVTEKVSKDTKTLELIQASIVELRTSLNPTNIVDKLIQEAGLNQEAYRLLQKYRRADKII